MVRGMKVIEDEGNAVREKQFKEKTKQEKNSFVSLKHVESPFSKTYEVCLHSCKEKKRKEKSNNNNNKRLFTSFLFLSFKVVIFPLVIPKGT